MFERIKLPFLYAFLDWFIPERIKAETDGLRKARMFLLSHVCGPIISIPIPLFLYLLSPENKYAPTVIAISIGCFWAFPFLLKLTGFYFGLAILSVQNLLFAIFWGCYHYGGFSSPFLPWLLTVPLFAFFYLGPGNNVRVTVITLITVNVAVFLGIVGFGDNLPELVPLATLEGIGMVSTFGAALYVSIMTLNYSNMVESQSVLEREIHRHQAMAKNFVEATNIARRAEQAKTEFLAKMSHELRTPLNAIMGYSLFLLEDARAEGSEQLCSDLEEISNSGRQLLYLITGVLDLSKLEAGKMELNPGPFGSDQLLEAIEDEITDEFSEQTIDLHIERPADEVNLVSDFEKVKLAVNYILRETAGSDTGGAVGLAMEQRDENFRITIRDPNSTLPAAKLEPMFHGLVSQQNESGSKYNNAKLGLAITHRLCALLGGGVTVEDLAEGGVIYTMDIPLTCEIEEEEVIAQDIQADNEIEGVGEVPNEDDLLTGANGT